MHHQRNLSIAFIPIVIGKLFSGRRYARQRSGCPWLLLSKDDLDDGGADPRRSDQAEQFKPGGGHAGPQRLNDKHEAHGACRRRPRRSFPS